IRQSRILLGQDYLTDERQDTAMKSAYWIQRAAAELGNPKDKDLAARIGVAAPTISQHRSGILKTLKDEHCAAIAEILDIDPAIVLMDQAAERASTPALRAQFQRLGKLASHGAAAGLATITAVSLVSF